MHAGRALHALHVLRAVDRDPARRGALGHELPARARRRGPARRGYRALERLRLRGEHRRRDRRRARGQLLAHPQLRHASGAEQSLVVVAGAFGGACCSSRSGARKPREPAAARLGAARPLLALGVGVLAARAAARPVRRVPGPRPLHLVGRSAATSTRTSSEGAASTVAVHIAPERLSQLPRLGPRRGDATTRTTCAPSA